MPKELTLKEMEVCFTTLRDNEEFALEAPLTSLVKCYLDSLKPAVHYWKASDRVHPGVSDIICCYRGCFVAIELKSATGRPTKKQESFIVDTIVAGGFGGVCSTIGEVKVLIDQVDRFMGKRTQEK
jgi:hypothetical protein